MLRRIVVPLVALSIASFGSAVFGQKSAPDGGEKPSPPSIVEKSRLKQPGLPPGVKAERDLAYVENGHERQKLDLYWPSDVKDESKPLPLIVWIHGGAWAAGNKDNPPALRLIPEGYAVASLNYRLSQHAVYPAQIEDCKTAVRWLRANAAKYRLDPDHFGAWGASAGGHLVALLGTTGEVKELDGKGANLDQSSRVQCVVDWCGPTDFTSFAAMADVPTSPVAKLLGGVVKEHRELAEKASPAKFANRNSAPFLIQHGDKDSVVPIRQSETLEQSLKTAGVEVTLQKISGAGHNFGNRESEIAPPIKAFFQKHLKNEK